MVAADRTRILIDDDNILPHWDAICLGVLCGMLFFAFFFLLVAALSSGRTGKKVFNGTGKNLCAQILNIFAIVLMLFFQVIWILVSCLLTIPVMLCVLLYILYQVYEAPCINLSNYGLMNHDREICGPDLSGFYNKTMDVLVCYIIAFIGAVLAAFSLTYFAVFACANFVYLRESKFSTYSVYKNDVQASRDSVIDTRM